MSDIDQELDFDKGDGLVTAVVQDASTDKVLMVGYMDQDALEATKEQGKVTFYSRSKKRLWTKGETSGNHLIVEAIIPDCDKDTLLIKAAPTGPACHTGADTCFFEDNRPSDFLFELDRVVQSRKGSDPETSYTAKLFSKGRNKVAQKVGEEAVELVIEAMDQNEELFLNEAADLMYHYLVLLADRGYRLEDVSRVLRERNGG